MSDEIMSDEIEIHHSDFDNQYGGLAIIKHEKSFYLRMGTEGDPRYFGPLTDEQFAAYYTLIEATEVGDL